MKHSTIVIGPPSDTPITRRILRGAILAACVCCGAGCSSRTTAVSVYVDPPDTVDNACVGVVGFEITLDSGADRFASGPLLEMTPVLDPSSCRIGRPFSASGIPLDAMVTVTVVGYDSARAARVSGTAQVPNLSGPPVRVQLSRVGAAKANVLVIARSTLLGGALLGDVTRMLIATQMRAQTLLDVDADAAGVYFSGVEPGAFGLDAVPDPDLTADFTLRQGGAISKVRLAATQNGAFWQTQAK